MTEARRICVVTGSRADYGLLLPVMRALQTAEEFQLQLAVTGMHLAPEFGSTYHQILADGFHIDARVDALVSSDSRIGNSKSTGLGVIGFADALAGLQPDFLLVLGDRYEIFAAVQAALFAAIPVIHLAGGDTTEGAFDEAIRHSISKMSHIHLVTNAQAGKRVRQLGENPAHIHEVGSPALDLLHSLPLLSRSELEESIGFPLRRRNLLITYHPVTLAGDYGLADLQQLFQALDGLGDEVGLIFTKANADVGGGTINAMLDEYVASRAHAVAHTSLGQHRYYSLMAQVDAVVGNSSSGLYEAPSLHKPTVNIGARQQGRLKAGSVIDCGVGAEAIRTAIDQALGLDCRAVVNPYGDGHSCERIMTVLRGLPPAAELLGKHFYDLEGRV